MIRIQLNATAKHGHTGREQALRFLIDAETGHVLHEDGSINTQLPPVRGLEGLTQPAAGPVLPPFPTADLEAARQANDVALMQRIQAEYMAEVQAAQAKATTNPAAIIGTAIAYWLAEEHQVYSVQGDHYRLDLATLQLSKHEGNGVTTYTLAPAATFGG